MSVVKKSRVKRRHKTAIAAYLAWLRENPKASRRQRISHFDFLVDSAELEKMING